MKNMVYHGTSTIGLKVIEPKSSTHLKTFVYASYDIQVAALFLSNIGGDFTCSIGRDSISKKLYICERFPEAFDVRYPQTFGAIYTLPATTFMHNQTTWNEEVVSEKKVQPVKEFFIENINQYLADLERKRKIIITKYPNKIGHVSNDDSDLVERAVTWINLFGQAAFDALKEFHPNLVNSVIHQLNVKNSK